MIAATKKLILTREYKDHGIFTCPYCRAAYSKMYFECNKPWCDTGYKCPTCHEDVLPHRSMKKEGEKP